MFAAQPAPLMARDAFRAMGDQLANFAVAILACNVLIPVWVALAAVVAGDSVSGAFESERNLITWFSSLQMLTIPLPGSDPRK